MAGNGPEAGDCRGTWLDGHPIEFFLLTVRCLGPADPGGDTKRHGQLYPGPKCLAANRAGGAGL